MEPVIYYRQAQLGDAKSISNLVIRVFDKFVGPGYSPDGQSIFHSYLQPDAIKKRLSTGFSFIFVALNDNEIVGAIEVKNGNHISVLFVDERYHKRGIATRLISIAIEKASHIGPITDITVNSSPYAVDIYKKLGFFQFGEELERDGIRHTPMRKYI